MSLYPCLVYIFLRIQLEGECVLKPELIQQARQHAKEAKLIYVTDAQKGITRIKKGKRFIYMLDGSEVKDESHLNRIKSLVIPPAWVEVWICKSANGHLQATGKDARNRKQYKYHPDWNNYRNDTKFNQMLEFGKVLPKLREKVNKDMSMQQLTQEKVIATAINLMENTHIRIGSQNYEKEYGSHGLTTLKDHHVKINGDEIKIAFKGKKGIMHKINLKSKKLARIIKQCRDIPGQELFQYVNGDNSYHAIDSGMVNEYIRNATGKEFTAKDFRTWAGTLHALSFFKTFTEAMTVAERKRNMVAVLDQVSLKLGNTRAVCKKYYVNPVLFSLYETDKLSKYLKASGTSVKIPLGGLSTEEKVLMRILKSNS